jgi:peptidyl-dipeptidase Dcp
MSSENPLLASSSLPWAALAFDRFLPEHFLPATLAACELARGRLAAIKSDPAPPDLRNTIVALERAGVEVFDVAAAYGNLRSAHGDDEMQALAREIMPKLIEFESDMYLDEALFARVRAVHDKRQTLGLSPEQLTLVEKTFRAFRRNGALLSPDDKNKLRAIDDELSTLGPRFSENVLKATNGYEMWITSEAALAGLPESAREAAKMSAREKGRPDAWLFTLHAPSYLAFMKYADYRAKRRELWIAYSSRAVGGEHGNEPLVKRIATLKHQRARLLGYQSHAHFATEERMAEHPDKVRAFLERLLVKSRPAAEREMAELKAVMAKSGQDGELMPWDYPYWARRLKEERYSVNAEELRPYFELGRVLDGAFEHARRLFGLVFDKVSNLPVYAPDVDVYQVKDEKTGEHMGLLYVDFYPRSTKSGGAWCTRYRGQWIEEGRQQRPHVSIVCNFTKPTPTKPSLLTFQEVTTLFHEFGHALHSLLSRCEFRSLSCTSVFRDFVELPSQIMENWVKEKESLALFARHYQTGTPIPGEMVDRVIASENFHAAYLMMRQLRFGVLDLAWYSEDPGRVEDVTRFELEAVRQTDLMPNQPGTNISCSFEHIFAGGYSAGYYGYKWAEVLDADAFEVFRQRGIFDRPTADRFRQAVLERGGSEHPMRLYQEFRGREPDPDALLRRAGLAG